MFNIKTKEETAVCIALGDQTNSAISEEAEGGY